MVSLVPVVPFWWLRWFRWFRSGGFVPLFQALPHASDLYMIHSALSRTSPNSTPVTDVHCTNPLIDNKRSRSDQKQIFKNTFKNRKLPTILMIWSFQR